MNFGGVSVHGIEYPDMQIQHCYRQPRQRRIVGEVWCVTYRNPGELLNVGEC